MGIRFARVNVKSVETRRLGLAACVTAAVLAMPAAATAQRQAFLAGIAELVDAAEGVYGDEGPRIGPALDAISRALETTPGVQTGRGLEEAAKGMPLVPLAIYRRGFEQLASGDVRSAIAEFRRAASTDPLVRGGPSEAQRVQGLRAWAASEFDKSIDQLEAAIRLNPGDERSRLALSRVFTAAGRDTDAVRVLEDTLRVMPASGRAHWWLATSYERVNRFADARREYEQAVTAAVAGRSQLLGIVGRLASAAADGPGAIDALTRAVASDPGNPQWHRLLAGAYLLEDRPDDAMAEFMEALRIDPRDADAHLGVGQIHLNAGRNAEAVDALRRAAALKPDSTDAAYALATALTRLGKPSEAAPYFERVEQAQRQRLAERRRQLLLDIQREEAARGGSPLR
jgi:tetratricopeptide (TPR) repeat protein